MAIVTTVPHRVYNTQRLYTTKAKINTEVEGRSESCGRWPGADLSGSRGLAHGSRVRPRHAPDSPSSLSRILMRPSTFHSLHAHSLTQSVGSSEAVRERTRGGTRWRTGGALLRPPPPRLVAISRRLTSRRRRHGGDVTNGTSHGPPAGRPPEPALTAPRVRLELSHARAFRPARRGAARRGTRFTQAEPKAFHVFTLRLAPLKHVF